MYRYWTYVGKISKIITLFSNIEQMFSRSRVFILGPSHHVYLDGCALPSAVEYETPLGNLQIDTDSEWRNGSFREFWIITDAVMPKTAVEELKKTGLFEAMSNSVDEDEHSIEMHLPYTYKIFER